MNIHCILNNNNRRFLDELNRNSGRPDLASCNSRSKRECFLLKYTEKIFSQYHNPREKIQLFPYFSLSLYLSLSLSLTHTHTHIYIYIYTQKTIKSSTFYFKKIFKRNLTSFLSFKFIQPFKIFSIFFILLVSFSFE